MFVTRDDPPPLYPGMISLSLDARGRLLEFLAPPTRDETRPGSEREAGPNGWRAKLLDAAGIDQQTFEEEFVRSQEKGTPPPVFADTWEVWHSRSGEARVEAAAYEGRPVLFRLAPRPPTGAGEPRRVFGLIMAGTVLTLFVTSLVLARRNWVAGRADRRGAMRLFVCASFLSWALQAHHVAGVGEQTMILETAARALLRGVLLCAAYIGLEPYLRKLWPRTLVSWSRLLAGRFHDPIIGRDLLVGVLGALALQFVGSAGLVLGLSGQVTVTADPAVRVGTGPFSLEPLLGPHVALGLLTQQMFAAAAGGLVMNALSVLVLRLLLRKTWLAVAVSVVFFSLPAAVRGDLLVATVVALWVSTSLFVFFRFGVLAVAVGSVAWRLLSWPVDFHLSSPHVDIGLVAYAAVAALACYGFYSAVRLRGRQPGLAPTTAAGPASPLPG
jgi:serine/threonine-protein kinase